MDISIIFKALRRQKTAALLIAFEIALACAIICNASFIIVNRLQRGQMPSGVAEAEVMQIRSGVLADEPDKRARRLEDTAGLRSIPGVVSVSTVQQVPFGGSSWNGGVFLQPDDTHPVINVTNYFSGGDLIQTFGLTLIAGRDFTSDEYTDFNDLVKSTTPMTLPIVISQAVAERIWPGENAVGKTLYRGANMSMRIIGVVQTLVRPSIWDDSIAQYSMILPVTDIPGYKYVLRMAPGADRHAMEQAARVKLKELQPQRLILDLKTIAEIREEYFQGDRVMAWMMGGVIAALLLVTALGIVGLASFWVQRRSRHIGIRRALGATRGQIRRYFQLENFLIVTAGVAVGMFAAYAINAWLMAHYELPRLPAWYLPLGAISLWLLGQLSVLFPARRAMQVPPAMATRSS